jgi:hypothetical protein
MATQFEIDCALMAGAAYRSNRPADKNKFPVPDGWVAFNHVNLNSGFEAVSFTDGNEIVISFAGTGDIADVVADVSLFAGACQTQLVQAAAYYLQIKSDPKYSNAHITFTGHSLGGGLAALLAVFFNENAVTFDQAPFGSSASIMVATALRSNLISTYPQTSSWLTPLNSFIDLYGDVLDVRESKVTNINVQGEVLSTLSALRIGTSAILEHGSSASIIELHSQSLLAAFLEDDRFRQVT